MLLGLTNILKAVGTPDATVGSNRLLPRPKVWKIYTRRIKKGQNGNDDLAESEGRVSMM